MNVVKQTIMNHFNVPKEKVHLANCSIGGGLWQKRWLVDPKGDGNYIDLGKDSMEVKANLYIFPAN